MKKIYLLTILTFFIFQSCTVMKDVTTTDRTASYIVSLDKVDVPSNSKENFSEPIQKEIFEDGVTEYSFEDENIRIFWIVSDKQFMFTIYNKTKHALKINWDDVVYVNTDKNISKMIHSGVKYSKMNEGQVATTLPKDSKLEDILVPVENIHLVSNEWTTLSLFPNRFYSDESMNKAKKLEGESVSILLPLMIENVQNDYTFAFKIEKVDTISETKTIKVHDKEAESNLKMAAMISIALIPVIILFGGIAIANQSYSY